MQPRRRSCVRPSAAERERKHFLKAILPPPIHAEQMRIPENFITRFGDELSNVAEINVPDGCVWKMGLKKCGKDVLFCNNWKEFAEYYSISYGHFLVFKYQGNSQFNVVIFDATSTEICYPCKTGGTNGEPNLDNNIHPECPMKRSRVDHQQIRSKKHREENESDADGEGKSRKKERSSCHGKLVKSPCNQNHTSRMSNSASKRARDAANKFKPKNPSFTSTINLVNVYLPSEFSAKYLKPKVPMKLQNSNGEQWVVSCIHHKLRSMRMVRGWAKFARDNELSDGDSCVFELIKRKPVVLKVTVFGAVEYGNSRRH